MSPLSDHTSITGPGSALAQPAAGGGEEDVEMEEEMEVEDEEDEEEPVTVPDSSEVIEEVNQLCYLYIRC